MKIAVTGALGYVGVHLCRALLDQGHEIVGFSRRNNDGVIAHKNYLHIAADTSVPGKWQDALAETDASINLAGQTIFHYWTESYKQKIYDSRIKTTENLVDALPAKEGYCLISTSAAGYYGDRADEPLIETASNGDDFLAKVCLDWENAARRAEEKQIRVVLTRFGIVLSRDGGAMEKMIPAFKCFVGGPVGTGKQWFPWIHLKDLIAAMMFILKHADIKGPVNFCGPTPITNRDMSKTLGRLLHRPAWLPAPRLVLSLALGEFGRSLLASQRVYPEKLLQHGYEFIHKDMESALRQIVSS